MDDNSELILAQMLNLLNSINTNIEKLVNHLLPTEEPNKFELINLAKLAEEEKHKNTIIK